jgi:hypothetical protein
MNLKMIGTIGAVILIVAVAGGVGWKLTQKAEGYKATGDQFNMRAEPRFGCATLQVNFNGKDFKESVSSPDSVNSGSNPL